MKFKKTDLINLARDEDVEGFEIIEEGEFIQEHKGQYQEIIFKYGGKFYKLFIYRQGSYHTDWYYDWDDWPSEVECREVEPVELKIVTWRPVKCQNIK